MKKGKNSEARHIRFYEWELKSDAYQSLDVYARALLVEFKRRYNGQNNGGIPFSLNEIQAALGCSNKPAAKALEALQDRGFVRLAQKGSFDWKSRGGVHSRASTWTLTEHPIDLPSRILMPGTKDYMRWKAPQKKSRGYDGTPLGVSRTPIVEKMGVSATPNRGTSSPHNPGFSMYDGGTSSPTYNIPSHGADTGPAERHSGRVA